MNRVQPGESCCWDRYWTKLFTCDHIVRHVSFNNDWHVGLIVCENRSGCEGFLEWVEQASLHSAEKFHPVSFGVRCMKGFSGPINIVGGVNPDWSHIPALSPVGLRDGEHGGGVSTPVSVISDFYPIEQLNQLTGWWVGTTGGVSTLSSRSAAKSPMVCID